MVAPWISIAQLVEDTRLLSIILPRQKSAGPRMAGDSIEKTTTDRKQVLSMECCILAS